MLPWDKDSLLLQKAASKYEWWAFRMRTCLFIERSCENPSRMGLVCLDTPNRGDTLYWQVAQKLLAEFRVSWVCTCPPNPAKGRLIVGLALCDRPDNAWGLATLAHELGHLGCPDNGSRRWQSKSLPWVEKMAWSIGRALIEKEGLLWEPDMEQNRLGALGLCLGGE